MARNWRKLKKRAYSGSGKIVMQPWPTLSLTSKQKKIYSRHSKVYSAEIERSVPKASMFQSYHPNWGIQNTNRTSTKWVSMRERGSLLSKRLWFLDNPAAVPGVAPMKKRRNLFVTQMRAWRTFHFWLGGLKKNARRKKLHNIETMIYTKGWWSLIHLLEASHLALFQKIGCTPTAMGARSWMRRYWFYLNGAPNRSVYARPGDVYTCSQKAVQDWSNSMYFLQRPLSNRYVVTPQNSKTKRFPKKTHFSKLFR